MSSTSQRLDQYINIVKGVSILCDFVRVLSFFFLGVCNCPLTIIKVAGKIK